MIKNLKIVYINKKFIMKNRSFLRQSKKNNINYKLELLNWLKNFNIPRLSTGIGQFGNIDMKQRITKAFTI